MCRKCCLAQTASPRLAAHHGRGALSSAWRLTSAVNRPRLFRSRIDAQISRSRGPDEDPATHGWGPRACLRLGVIPAKAGTHAETFQAVTASSAWTPAVAGVTVVGGERWSMNRPRLFRGRIDAQISRSRGPGEDPAAHRWGRRTCLTLGVIPAKAGIHAETFQPVTASSAWTPAVAGVTVVGGERSSVNRLCCRTISAGARISGQSNRVDDGREWPPLRAAQVPQPARHRTNSNPNRPQWLNSGGRRFSPASMRIGSTFSLGGSGHTACSVKAQGGLIALLKSRTIVFSVTFSPNTNRDAG